MNTTLNTKRILCYGDSNTWGSMPGKSIRFPINVRWTGLLQEFLGKEYEIIEEGLSARTTDIDDADHMLEMRNGAKYLIPCLNSHIPLDYVVLFLGTNDLKFRYNRTADDVVKSIDSLVKTIRDMKYIHKTIPPKVVLICPALIDENEEGIQGKYQGARIKSERLSSLMEDYSFNSDLPFINLSKAIRPLGHLDQESHRILAELLAAKIKEIDD